MLSGPDIRSMNDSKLIQWIKKYVFHYINKDMLKFRPIGVFAFFSDSEKGLLPAKKLKIIIIHSIQLRVGRFREPLGTGIIVIHILFISGTDSAQ